MKEAEATLVEGMARLRWITDHLDDYSDTEIEALQALLLEVTHALGLDIRRRQKQFFDEYAADRHDER